MREVMMFVLMLGLLAAVPGRLHAEEHSEKTLPGDEGKKMKYERPGDEEIKKMLSPLQCRVTQEGGTEQPFNNEYWDNKADGIYVDVVSREPLFTPILTGIPFSRQALAISAAFFLGKFPGFILILSAPCLIDSKARSAEKWMSATRGIFILFFISPTALADFISGIPTLTISQPAFSSFFI